jgi:hypothetical protein
MNREVFSGLIVGLAIGLFASILLVPEEWMALKRNIKLQTGLSSLDDYEIGSEEIADEDVH